MKETNIHGLSEKSKQTMERFAKEMISRYGVRKVQSAVMKYKSEAGKNRG